MRNWLVIARKSKRLNQKEVAELCDISDAYYCYIENGQRTPSVAIAKKIAQVLGLKWTNFFENKTNDMLDFKK